MRHTYYLYPILLGLGLSLQACSGTRYLQANEYLLARQHIQGNKKVKRSALTPYYQQQSNRTWLAMPVRLWIHEFGKKSYDTTTVKTKIQHIEDTYAPKLAAAADSPRKLKRLQQHKAQKLAAKKRILEEGNWWMRWGEPPVIYNPQQKDLTENNLLRYLHTKGYFDAQVSSKVKLRHKRAYITYQIKENKPYLIRKIQLNTADTAIQQLLEPYEQQSLMQQGQNYDQDVLTHERERIQELLLNQGYFGFSKQYISFNIDTTGDDRTVAVETVVALPTGSKAHRTYPIDSVVWVVAPKQPVQAPTTISTYQGITFKAPHKSLNPKVIASKIPLTPSQLYSAQAIIETRKRLARLDMFRYIHITHDTTAIGNLITYIHTAPTSSFQLANELGIQVSQDAPIPQPSYELSLKSRNLFKQLEILKLGVQISLEEVTASTGKKTFYNSQTYDASLELTLPQFLLPLRTPTYMRLDTYQPATKATLGGSFTSRPDYTRSSGKASLSYDWKSLRNASYTLTPLRIEIIDSNVSEQFKEELEKRKAKGDNLYRTYQPSFVSSLSFQTTIRSHQVAGTAQPRSYVSLHLESGGALQNLLDFRKLISKKLMYYKYWQFDVTYSQCIPLRPSTILAYQMTTGLAYPYDEYSVLPPDKNYFAGGSSGIRAWSSRSLGPGSYDASTAGTTQQPGELTLQGSVELRQPLVGLLESALFVDLGNVWMIHKTDRIGADFSFKRFYKEIAVGAGIGLRLNFNFLVLRLDVGLKLYDPAKPLGARLFPAGTWKELTTLNLGLGYPF